MPKVARGSPSVGTPPDSDDGPSLRKKGKAQRAATAADDDTTCNLFVGKTCGTPGCNLPDWHPGACEPLKNLGERRIKRPSRFITSSDEIAKKARDRSSGKQPTVVTSPAELEPITNPATWVQCDRCSKWRLLFSGEVEPEAGKQWFCEMSSDEQANTCDAPQVSQCQDVEKTLSRDLFYVEYILDERAARGKKNNGAAKGSSEFLVRWLGWTSEHDTWEPEAHIADKSLIEDFHQRKVTTTTDISHATWAFVAECPMTGGRGLFARADLRVGQAICEYGGPRLPVVDVCHDGKYVLCLPETRIAVDGNCDNVYGYSTPRYAAIFSNHSSTPNARMEYWPNLSATEYESSGHMWLVASEPIAKGQEIRFDYEAGSTSKYWLPNAVAPSEGDWRGVRAELVGPDVPAKALPALNVLDAIREASEKSCKERKRFRSPEAYKLAFGQMTLAPVTPLTQQQADVRIRELASQLARTDNKKTWGLLASHLPGWGGKECYDRWAAIGRPPVSNTDDDGKRSCGHAASILRKLK